MKKLVLAGLGAVAFASSAFAADMPARVYTKAPPPAYVPPQIYNWTGFYIGGHLGGAFDGNSGFGNSSGRFLGGLQAGADYQFATNWVIGIEGQYSWTDRTTSSAAFVPGGFTISDRASNLGSVTGRLGYAWGPALFYAKGGVAFRDGNGVWDTDTLLGTARPFTVSKNTVGYTVGTGLEYMFTPNWSGKVEYQYYNFGKTNVTDTLSGTTVGYTRDTHTVKAGVNYRFNWGG